MARFKTKLISGNKTPYNTWTFVVIPESIRKPWKKARIDVCGTINGEPFRGTVSKGEGVHRMPVKKELLGAIGAKRGQVVEIDIDVDRQPRPLDLPDELKVVLEQDKSLAELFDALAPSHRRAWASYIADAKRPETRARRAQKAPEGIRARAFPNQ